MGNDETEQRFRALIEKSISARVDAESAVRASEARFRAILHGVQAGVVVHGGPDLRIVACNTRAAELLGLPEPDMVGRLPAQLPGRRIREDGSPIADENLPYRVAQRTGKQVCMTMGVWRQGGAETLWLAVDANPVLAPDGTLEEVIVTFMDVSLQIRAAQEIKRAADFTEDVLDSLQALVAVLDEKGIIIAVNQAWRRHVTERGGQSPGFLGWNYLAVCDAASAADGLPDAGKAAHGIRDVLAGKAPDFALEYRCDSPDEQRWYRMRVNPLRGNRRGVVVSHHNISQHIHTLQASRAAESRYRALFEQAAVGVARIDPATGRLVEINRRLGEIFGHPAEDLTVKTFLELTHPEDVADATMAWTELFDGRRPALTWESRFLRADGSAVWAGITVSPVTQSGEVPDHFIAIVQDINERKSLEEQFRQAQKMEAIGQLSGGVAHDFNNLLTVIKGHAELIQGRCAEPPGNAQSGGSSIGDSVEQIMVAANRATNLTRQLLMFSRRQVMRRRVLDLHHVCHDMIKMLRHLVGEQVAISLMPADAPVSIRADVGMIDQVLLNLAVNARDAMPRGGRIYVAVHVTTVDAAHAAGRSGVRPGEFARLTVRDTGTGIPPEVLPRIFEPFYTTKEAGRGTGLGLATVYGIVQQHEGWIEVDSAVGRGTTFSVYLPTAREALRKGDALAPGTSGTGTGSILLVEDEPALRAVTEIMLGQRGYRVKSAASAAEAVELWLKVGGDFDLLLTDLVIPGPIDGRNLARQLKLQKPSLRVIYISGYSSEFAGRDVPLQEGENFLSKPFDGEQLATAVKSSLR